MFSKRKISLTREELSVPVVITTPGDSIRPIGDIAPVMTTPGGSLQCAMGSRPGLGSPICEEPAASVGSICPTGGIVPVMKTSGVSIHHQKAGSSSLLGNNPVKVEAMDYDEGGDDTQSTTPFRVWIRDTTDLKCPKYDPLLHATTTAAHIENVGNAPNIVNVTSIEADVRPSVSGVTAMSRPVAMSEVWSGSDSDSEYDDEFDVTPVQSNVFPGLVRDIPDDDELEESVREAIDAVQNAMDEEVGRRLGVLVDFQWEADFETFRGRSETFSVPKPGSVKDYDTPYDAFTDIWDRGIIERITLETNRYARQTIDTQRANGTLEESSRLHQWVDTNADEMMILFAVYMYMGIDPRTSQKEYWMTNTVLEMPKFRQLMSYNRYILLSKFLHFIDNSDVSQNLNSSEGVVPSRKLAKLAPVISHLKNKFSSLYILHKNISVNEFLTLFKGRFSWVQTIRSKDGRFGIKSYELCETHTGYMFNFEIYMRENSEGNSSADAPLSVDLGVKSTRIVLDLLKGLESRGHCVTMDNFFNSPALARYLKSLGFDCLGVLRSNRKNVPSDIANVPKNVAKGTIVSRHCGDVSIIAWKDIKVVNMISTYHDAETYVGKTAGEMLVKPVCVKDYNKFMGGVDLKDQKLSMHLLERKRGVKWYVKMFKRLLNVSIHNAFILHASSSKRRNKSLMTHRDFRYELAKGLVEKHRSSQLEVPVRVDENMRLRRDIVHVPRYLSGNANRKRCDVCSRKGKEKKVHTLCVTCDEYMCFGNCWEEWHSSPNLKEKDTRGRKRARVA